MQDTVSSLAIRRDLLKRFITGAVVLFVSQVLSACDSPIVEPSEMSADLLMRESCYDPDDPQCVNTYPLPDDPDPRAPGYFIGTGYSLAECRQGMYDGDNDLDGLDEKCEYRLAHALLLY